MENGSFVYLKYSWESKLVLRKQGVVDAKEERTAIVRKKLVPLNLADGNVRRWQKGGKNIKPNNRECKNTKDICSRRHPCTKPNQTDIKDTSQNYSKRPETRKRLIVVYTSYTKYIKPREITTLESTATNQGEVA